MNFVFPEAGTFPGSAALENPHVRWQDLVRAGHGVRALDELFAHRATPWRQLGRAPMQQVAEELAMHRRTLDRRLQLHGIGFQALVDEVRYEVARQLLRDTEMPIIAIVQSLHFADASILTRAFRRWSGKTPSRWRAESRSLL